MDQHPVILEATKTLPITSIAGASVLGLSIPDWTVVLGALYAVLLIAHKVYQCRKEVKHDREAARRKSEQYNESDK